MNDRVNILMVDDQPAKLLSYEAILGELGENLIKATSGREALEHLLKNEVAVVLMDVSMPEMDGFEMAEIIRQHPRFQKTAIIFISGVHLTDLDRLKGYERGAVDYISVPVVPEVLRAKVSVFAELHRKTRELKRLNRDLEQRVLERTEELRESESQFRTLANSIPQLAWMARPDGSVFWFNQRWYDYTGGAFEQMKGSGWESVHHPDHAQRIISGLQHSWRSGDEWEDTCPLRGHDGQYRWFLSRAVPIRDSHGNIVRWFGTSTDISRQRAAEEQLRERAELLDLATEAIVVRDMQANILFWNSGAEHLYGWKREEVMGKNLHHLLATRFPAPVEQIESALIETGYWGGNLVQRTRDDHEITVACRKAFKVDGERRVVLEINRDITAQLQAEEALRKTERLAAMGRVAGIIAHEINNPLEAITNAFFLLRDLPSLDDQARYYTKLVAEELERISHITRQTLSFYRESQQPVPLLLARLLDDVLELQTRPLQRQGIKLERDYRSAGEIAGFPAELKQVFLNLIGNAVQAMPGGGRLRLSIHATADPKTQRQGVKIMVSDTGMGIEPEHAKRLFEPFFTTKSVKGTGLGLWISKGIVQKYEGNIQFRSLRVNGTRATCFSVFIPAWNAGNKSKLAVA